MRIVALGCADCPTRSGCKWPCNMALLRATGRLHGDIVVSHTTHTRERRICCLPREFKCRHRQDDECTITGKCMGGEE